MKKYFLPMLLFLFPLNVLAYAGQSVQAILSGRYVLEIPHTGLDPRYEGKKYRYDLTLKQNGTYVLRTWMPIIKWKSISDAEPDVITEVPSISYSTVEGRYSVEGDLLTLSKRYPIEHLKFIDGSLYYEGNKFQKIDEANKIIQPDRE